MHMQAFDDFVGTIARLRSPEGCPWDREQTHASIGQSMIEEAYEALDAIERDDMRDLREELGDVLLQVVLQSQIAADAGEFTIEDVCRDIDAKMIRRHPHVFGEQQAANAADVERLWEAVKQEEKTDQGILESVPKSLPALLQIQKIMKRIKRAHPEDVAAPCDVQDEAQLVEAIAALAVAAQDKGINLEEAVRTHCQTLREEYRA